MAQVNRKPETIALEEHSRRMWQKQKRIDDLEADMRALQAWIAAQNGTGAPPDSDIVMLRDVADVLRKGYAAGEPAAAGQAMNAATHRPKPGSRPPSGGDPRARRALKHFRLRIRTEIATFHQRWERDMERDPDVDETVDVARKCWRRNCASYGRRISPLHQCTPKPEE